MYLARLPLLLLVLFAAAGPALGAASNDKSTLASWILAQIRAGKDVDFNERCGTDKLDPHSTDDPRWAANCRSVDPDILRALLARPGLAESAPHGVHLRGVRIDGTLNLDDVQITAAEFTLTDSSLAGDLILTSARLNGWLIIDDTVITGRLNAATALIDRGLVIERKAAIGGELGLMQTVIGDSLAMADATLTGGMNAIEMQVGSSGLAIQDVEFDGDVVLAASKIQGAVAIVGSKFKAGKLLNASQAQFDSFFTVLNSEFSGDVAFLFMKVSGSVALVGVTFASGKRLNAGGLRTGTGMAVENVEFDGGVSLDSADIHDHLVMSGVKFPAGAQFIASGIQIGGTLRFATQTDFGGGVFLANASIGRDLTMPDSRVAPGMKFNAVDAQIGGNFLLGKAEFGGDVALDRANVRGQVNLEGAKFSPDAVLSVENLHVGQDFYFRYVESTRPINAISLSVGGSFDLSGSTLGGIDLSGASVGGDLRLGGTYSGGKEAWTKWAAPDGARPQAMLRNTRVGNLQDDSRSWDGADLVLEGFIYGHLGGVAGVNRQDMRYRSVKWWRNWLRHDPVYSPQPYTQLASVLAASGNSEAASKIRYAGRERQRTELLRGCAFWHPTAATATTAPPPPCDPAGWLGLSVLQVTVGYGIGSYTFRAVLWTLGLTVAGTIILAFAPGVRGSAYLVDRGRAPRQKPLLWCFGAALNHVLPVVTLNPEFNDFFNDSKRERLYAWQQVAFAILALCGWALSFFVIAALSGLTQG